MAPSPIHVVGQGLRFLPIVASSALALQGPLRLTGGRERRDGELAPASQKPVLQK